MSCMTAPDLRSILKAQRIAFAKNPSRFAARFDALRSLESVLLKRQSDIVDAISQDFGGRAPEETIALELLPLLNEIRYARRRLKGWMGPHRAKTPWQFWPGKAQVFYEPLGVVGILASWN